MLYIKQAGCIQGPSGNCALKNIVQWQTKKREVVVENPTRKQNRQIVEKWFLPFWLLQREGLGPSSSNVLYH